MHITLESLYSIHKYDTKERSLFDCGRIIILVKERKTKEISDKMER